jgi:hypothetical protein
MSGSPLLTRAAFSTKIETTLPGSSGWIIFERPLGRILPCAAAWTSSQPKYDHMKAANTPTVINKINGIAIGDAGVSSSSNFEAKNSLFRGVTLAGAFAGSFITRVCATESGSPFPSMPEGLAPGSLGTKVSPGLVGSILLTAELSSCISDGSFGDKGRSRVSPTFGPALVKHNYI